MRTRWHLGPYRRLPEPSGPLLRNPQAWLRIWHHAGPLHPGHRDAKASCNPYSPPSGSGQPFLPGTGEPNRLLQDLSLFGGETGIPEGDQGNLLQCQGSGDSIGKHGPADDARMLGFSQL